MQFAGKLIIFVINFGYDAKNYTKWKIRSRTKYVKFVFFNPRIKYVKYVPYFTTMAYFTTMVKIIAFRT